MVQLNCLVCSYTVGYISALVVVGANGSFVYVFDVGSVPILLGNWY